MLWPPLGQGILGSPMLCTLCLATVVSWQWEAGVAEAC